MRRERLLKAKLSKLAFWYEIVLVQKAALAPQSTKDSRLAVRMFALRRGWLECGGVGVVFSHLLDGFAFQKTLVQSIRGVGKQDVPLQLD